MTKGKGSTNHSEPSESINPKFTAEAVCDLANRFHDHWAEENKNKNISLETQVWNLAAKVCMNKALILKLQEAASVKNSKEELLITTVRDVGRKVAELEAKVNVQQMANSVRLEKLEGRK